MNTLYFIRHGENHANITKEFSYKYVDYPLTDKGRLQAGQTAGHLKKSGTNFSALYTSPLKRAKETADIIGAAVGLVPIPLEELREINVGELENRPPTKENWDLYMRIVRNWQREDRSMAFPGGDTYASIRERAAKALSEAARGRDGENVMVLGHGGFFEMAVRLFCRGDFMGFIANKQNSNCSISILKEDGGALEIAQWADFSHLYGDAADMVSGLPDYLFEKGVRK